MSKRQDREQAEKRTLLQGLPMVRRQVAGIDLGSERHWVCAPTVDGKDREIASFGATTPELLRMEHVVLLPHIGSASLKTRTLMATMASENIVAHAHGLRPPYVVNAEVLNR